MWLVTVEYRYPSHLRRVPDCTSLITCEGNQNYIISVEKCKCYTKRWPCCQILVGNYFEFFINSYHVKHAKHPLFTVYKCRVTPAVGDVVISLSPDFLSNFLLLTILSAPVFVYVINFVARAASVFDEQTCYQMGCFAKKIPTKNHRYQSDWYGGGVGRGVRPYLILSTETRAGGGGNCKTFSPACFSAYGAQHASVAR